MKLFNITILFLLYTVTIFSQWESIGPYGGYIRCLTKENSGRVLSGNAYGGIFRSSDVGKNWEQLFIGYRNEDVRSLAVNSNNHIFAGTDLHGLYRSTNDGVTWERLFNLVYDRTVEDILIKDNGDIFLATFDGVYRSTDNGNTFILTSNGITTSLIYSLGVSANYIFAGTANNGIFRSSDDGANWEEANTGITFQGRNVYDFSSPEFVYGTKVGKNGIAAGKIYATFGDKIVGSSTAGTNWEEYNIPPGNYLHLLQRNSGNIVAVGSSIINSSTQGNTWEVIAKPTDANITFVIEVDDNTVITGSEGPGTFVSTDNMMNWNLEVNKMPATAITGINTSGSVINVSTRHSGIFKSIDGQNWENITSNIPHGWFYNICRNPMTNTYFTLHQNGVYRSTDGAASWNGPSVFGAAMNFNSLGNTFIASGSYVYKSIDDGVTYQQKLVNNSVTYIRQIAVGSNDNILLATANNNGFGGQGVYASLDLGETYEPINTGLPNNITAVEAIDLTGFTPEFCINNFAAASSDGKYFSMNADHTWNEINVGFQQNLFVKDIAFINSTQDFNIAVLSEDEIYKLSTGDNCGFTYDLGLPYTTAEIIASLKVQSDIFNSENANYASTEYAYLVGTVGAGILKKVIFTNVNNPSNYIPSKLEISQNYPNPFNPSTKIKYTIPASPNHSQGAALVQIKVYDVLGNEIATLVNEEKPAGSYEVNFNSVETLHATSLPSGVYFYQLKAGDYLETKKMILLK